MAVCKCECGFIHGCHLSFVYTSDECGGENARDTGQSCTCRGSMSNATKIGSNVTSVAGNFVAQNAALVANVNGPKKKKSRSFRIDKLRANVIELLEL